MIEIKFEDINKADTEAIVNGIPAKLTRELLMENPLVKLGGDDLMEALLEDVETDGDVLDVLETIITDGFDTGFKMIIHFPYPWEFVVTETDETRLDFVMLYEALRELHQSFFINAIDDGLTSIAIPLLYNETLNMDTMLYNIYSTAKTFEPMFATIQFYTVDIDLLKRWAELFPTEN